jgi:hypothetical protein
MHVAAADSQNEVVNELIEILSVHRVEKRGDGRVNRVLRWVGNPLLKVVRRMKPNVSDDCAVLFSHLFTS